MNEFLDFGTVQLVHNEKYRENNPKPQSLGVKLKMSG